VHTTHNRSTILFDSLQNAVITAIEIGGNRLLALDEAALQGCTEMQGYCITIDITDLDFKLYCHPGNWGLRLSREAPAREVDASISGRMMALVNLAAQEDKLSTSISERVSFHGNVALAQKVQRIFAELDIDWEEALAEHSGDVLAFQIHQGVRKFGKWLQGSADSLIQTSSEYLREEARLSPTLPEYRQFQARATDLKNDVARAELRLQRLLDKLGHD
jgi:ubiquinone biosynthesis accessory factor UbiJ